MFQHVDRCARALKSAGVKRGDSITLCVSSVPEVVYLLIACSKIGVLACFINPMFTTEQMVDRMNETESHLLFVLDKTYSFIAEAIDKTCIERVIVIPITNSLPTPVRILASLKGKSDAKLKTAMRDAKFSTWRSFVQAGKSYVGIIEEPYEREMPLVMVYSSGTTGASKGIVLTNDGIHATLSHYRLHGFTYERGNTFLQIIPVWFSTGTVVSILMPLSLGLTVILEPVFSNVGFAHDLNKYTPNVTLATASLWLYAMNCNELYSVDLSSMTYPLTGGEQLLPEAERKLNDFLAEHNSPAKMEKGWGMCELGGPVTATSYLNNKLGSTGYPIINVMVAAFNIETNEELPYGEHGELRVCSPTRMKGYYKNPEATAAFFHTDVKGNVWGRTGDIGYIDENGDVFVLGRAENCFYTPEKSRVYLFDIESVILRDPSVELCKVVDIEINRRSVPVAHIVLKTDETEAVTDALQRIDSLCREELTEYAIPLAYKIRDSFPIATNTKLDTEALRSERDGFINGVGEEVQL